MVGSETEARDATLHEIIDWCTEWANQLCDAREGDFYADFLQVDTLTHVIDHCKHMLESSGTMPSEVENQSEDAQ